ncbi:V-type ATP synthase subunit D [Desulfovermiculus halophilus]|jgi:V/A-type H+-transporting ATPase subunit D|uniref:V-type ATP synthase subunit D n=1 Tax=Desulfovermiculus halophilus TaxID=339722 RepID=UPI00048920C5|nr:V-type ATP synthase subunit D [Desulfovermiculus halophilus]
MAKIKLTKAELKAQREALHRYQRFLPTLQLKKEQLQGELRRVSAELAEVRQELDRIRSDLSEWISLFSEDPGLSELIHIQTVQVRTANIAGVTVRHLDDVQFAARVPDLKATPPWVDPGLDRIKKLIRLRIREELTAEKYTVLSRELRTATQRVNLFEKVKIPDCRENIRIIRIALGEEQTAAIARAKLAKSKIQEWSTGA